LLKILRKKSDVIFLLGVHCVFFSFSLDTISIEKNNEHVSGRGRQRNTWRRDFIAEMEIEGYRWQDLERMAQNRTRRRTVVSGL